MTAPDLSLRGVKRRGNPFGRWCETTDGLLRLRLAMTVGMARNDSNLCHCEERSDEAIHFSGGARLKMDCFAFGLQLQWGGLQLQWEWFVMTAPDLSLRGAKRRGNLFFRWCKTKAGLLRLRLAMTGGLGSQ